MALVPYKTARKTISSFSRHPEKIIFLKNLRWNMIFLVLSGKMTFLFPENIILHLKWKMKDDLSQKKIHGNIIFSSSFLKRWSFQKEPGRDMAFFVLSGKVVFFSQEKKKNRKLNISGWSLASSSIHLVGDFLQWIIFNHLYHSTLRRCVWRCAWAPIKEITCPLGDGLYIQNCKSGSKNFLVQR